jgi:hypothetical protein
MKYLFLLALLVLFVENAPAADQVHFPIKDYNNHLWYSGIFMFDIQAISISIWEVFITSISNPKPIQIMTLLFYGSTEAQDVPV